MRLDLMSALPFVTLGLFGKLALAVQHQLGHSDDVAAEILYTSAKEGDKGTFEDLKFTDGSLVSWGEAQHTMPPKERSEITTTLGYGRHGGRSDTGQPGNAPSQPSESPTSSAPANPFSVTF